MHTQSANGAPSVGTAAKDVADHAKRIVSLELELATAELKRKVAALGVGVGMLVGAGIFALFMLGFLFATIAAVFATFLSTWLALLIVTLGILVLFVLPLAILGLGGLRKGSPPVPEQAIREAKLTSEALKSDADA